MIFRGGMQAPSLQTGSQRGPKMEFGERETEE